MYREAHSWLPSKQGGEAHGLEEAQRLLQHTAQREVRGSEREKVGDGEERGKKMTSREPVAIYPSLCTTALGIYLLCFCHYSLA